MHPSQRLGLFLFHLLGPAPLVACVGSTPKETGDTGTTPALDDIACLSVPLGEACPSEETARADLVGMETCESPVREVVATGAWVSRNDVIYTGYGGYVPYGGSGSYTSTTLFSDPQTRCCYDAAYIIHPNKSCTIGRPLSIGEALVSADAIDRDGWVGSLPAPDLSGMGAHTRQALAEAWTAAALLEHASIPAFARVVLDLVALGAPAALVARTNAALADEIVHAEVAFALASAYAGKQIGPTGLQTPHRRKATLKRLAVEAYVEGCVGETLAVALAAAQLREATDPAVRAVLERIVNDEARHAALAWDTVAFAIAAGGAPVRRAVANAAATRTEPQSGLADAPVAAGHGLPAAAGAQAALEAVMRTVIAPATAQLLAA